MSRGRGILTYCNERNIQGSWQGNIMDHLLSAMHAMPDAAFLGHIKYPKYFLLTLNSHSIMLYIRAYCHKAIFSKTLAWVFFWCLFMYRNGTKILKNLGRRFHD